VIRSVTGEFAAKSAWLPVFVKYGWRLTETGALLSRYTSRIMMIITENALLEQLCERLAREPYITVDTEFMRERTYWSKLCLIQVASDNDEAIIDPLADGLELGPFYELMSNRDVLKVFHAARQDIEIFYHASGHIPHPIFDTQIAAMVCGFGEQIGYEGLIRQLTGGHIDKGSRFTDWARRPLSEKQLVYALGDVTHLRDAYKKLQARLDTNDRTGWLAEEMAILESPATYDADPENAWRRVKMRIRKKQALAIMIDLAAWREREAQDRNLPRQRIVKDEILSAIAAHPPSTLAELEDIRGISKGFSRSAMAKSLLKAVEAGKARDPDSVPQTRPASNRQAPPAAITDMLKVVLKMVSEEHGVAARLVASVADLEKIAADDKADVPALKGWRYTLFGEKALKIKRGELCIALYQGKPELLPVADD
jgi:ribonuclease D